MINENKVKMLTKLAVTEKTERKSSKELMKMSRKGFVGKGVWWTYCAATVAFIFTLVIWAVVTGRFEQLFLDFINGDFYMFTHVRIWIEYFVFIAAFIIIALIYYNKKYSKKTEALELYRKRYSNLEKY